MRRRRGCICYSIRSSIDKESCGKVQALGIVGVEWWCQLTHFVIVGIPAMCAVVSVKTPAPVAPALPVFLGVPSGFDKI